MSFEYTPPKTFDEPYIPPVAPIKQEISGPDRDYWNRVLGDRKEFQKFLKERFRESNGDVLVEIANSIIGEVDTGTEEQLLSFMPNVSLVEVDRGAGRSNSCAAFPTVFIELDQAKYAVHQSVTHCFNGLSSLSLDTISGAGVTFNGELLRNAYLVANRDDLLAPFDSALLLSPVIDGLAFSRGKFEVRSGVDEGLLDELIREKVDIWQAGFPVSEQKVSGTVRAVRKLNTVRYELEGSTTKIYFSHVDGQVSTAVGDKGYSGGPLFYFNELGVPVIIATTYGVNYKSDSGEVVEIIGINIIPEDSVVRFANSSGVNFMRLNWSLPIAGSEEPALIDGSIYSGSFNLSQIGADLVSRGGYDREQSEKLITSLRLAYLREMPEKVRIVNTDSPFELYVYVELEDGQYEVRVAHLEYTENGDVVVNLSLPSVSTGAQTTNEGGG